MTAQTPRTPARAGTWRRTLPALALAAAMAATAPVHAAPAPEDDPIVEDTSEAFWWGDFDALERANALYKLPGHDGPGDASQLERFRKGLMDVINSGVKHKEAHFKELEALTLQWATEHPQSALAHCLHARVLMMHGWSYRGTGFAKDVLPQAWADYEAYQRRAFEYMKAHADVALTDSYGHTTLLLLGRDLGWDRKTLEKIMWEGVKRNPDDLLPYFHLLTAMLPKWGGDARSLDAFVRRVVEHTRGKYGTGMYERLYAAATKEQYGNALFQESLADWDMMQKSYDDMLARFPDNTARLNGYAYMACLAKDKPKLLALLDRLGPKLDPAGWGSNGEHTAESCQRWAREK